MIKIKRPFNLNGFELRQELRTLGVIISDDLYALRDDSNGYILLEIAEKHEIKAKEIISAHNGTTVTHDNSAAKAAATAKLAALGLTTDDLKALGLGGNE